MSHLSQKISTTEIERFVEAHYQIVGEATLIYGELDLNFKITTPDTSYLLKIAQSEASSNALAFQVKLLEYLNTQNNSSVSNVILSIQQEPTIYFQDQKDQLSCLLSWQVGRLWSTVNPITSSLRIQLGKKAGEITKALLESDLKLERAQFDWDTSQALWVKDHLHLFNENEQAIIKPFIKNFESILDEYQSLRKCMIHNDVNDNNIIVSNDLTHPEVTGIIDFGDATYTQLINDVGITCAYASMNCVNPLEAAKEVVEGYHSTCTLQENELRLLYHAIALRLVISVTKSTINKQLDPTNEYLQVSEKSAWDSLAKWQKINSEFAHYTFRKACGYDAHPSVAEFNKWSSDNTFSFADLFPTVGLKDTYHLDLSVGSSFIGTLQDMNNLDLFQFKIEQLQKEHPDKLLVGGYCEPRTLYTSTSYDRETNEGTESRTIHIGLDVWLPEYTPVHALFDGEVVTACDDHGYKEYGGLVILKHQFGELTFFTLYGHNSVESVLHHKIGDLIKKGDKIAELGDSEENGVWAPHLHFEIMLSMLDYEFDFPGVAYKSELEVWKDICPNPDLLFKQNLPDNELKYNTEDLLKFRSEHLGKGLSLQYNHPVHIVRGSGVYLIDTNGKKYLDTVNNVAHVGHEHPAVVKSAVNQIALLNTNTRYIHQNINELTQELLKHLPDELSVIHYVNSGSEANELAIRMVKTITNSNQIIASEIGYHGNTNMCVDISSYKFDGKGGDGAPSFTHIFPMPDTFRGKYRGHSASEKYASEVKKIIVKIQDNGEKVGGFIMEPILSCGGQIVPPNGFLKSAYHLVREAGGICISDEVQTGLGRMGSTFWGYELHDVIPDIITIGKPFGNGHPVAAVVCTKEIAASFANGMEFFNTFGGNPVSCAIGKTVLQTVVKEQLQQNAQITGTYLKEELKKLSDRYPIIGDIRGEGLFLGIELVNSNREPLPKHTTYLINRMKSLGVFMSSDGPDYNVLKIKPPISFNKSHADTLLVYLGKVFKEDMMNHYD